MITVGAAWQLQSLLMLVSQLSRGTVQTCCLGQLFKPNACPTYSPYRCQHTHSFLDQYTDKRLQLTRQ